MAFRHLFLCSLLLLFLGHHHVSAAKYSLPLVRDDTNPQFYTTLLLGTPRISVNLVVDIGNRYTWFACETVNYNKSSTFAVVPCVFNSCNGCIVFSLCKGPATPLCTNNVSICDADVYTPWNPNLKSGYLLTDTISISSAPVPKFQFACSSNAPLNGLSARTKGVLTLARTPNALHARVSSALKLPRKFAICAPSSSGAKGAIFFGGGPYTHPPSTADLSKSLVTTALVVNPHITAPSRAPSEAEGSIEYFIGLRSIEIDGTALKLNTALLTFDKNGFGGTKISTMDPYTSLHSQIYKPFVNLFVAKAAALKLVKVAPVAPFGACFSSASIRYNAATGAGLPVVDLVLNEKTARWRIYGSNSMVTVSKNVQCLGFVDGGSPMTAIAIGAKQLEDNLLEFDLVANRLGFTSSLLRLGTSCSQLK